MFPDAARSRGRRRRAARRPRAGRRPRAVDLRDRPEQGRLRRAEAGGAEEPAARRGDHARRRHPRPLRRRAATGCRCRSATTPRRSGCWCSPCSCCSACALADGQAPPVLGAADPGTATAGRRTVVELGGLARTDRAGYGEEFDRLTAEVLGTRPDRRRAGIPDRRRTARERRGARHLQRPAVHGGGRGLPAGDGHCTRRSTRPRRARRTVPPRPVPASAPAAELRRRPRPSRRRRGRPARSRADRFGGWPSR